MSLKKPDETQPVTETTAPAAEPTPAAPETPKKSRRGGVGTGEKTAQANEIAPLFKDKSWMDAKDLMKAEAQRRGYLGISDSTFYAAYSRAKGVTPSKKKGDVAQKPSIKINDAQKKNPAFLTDQTAQAGAGVVEELGNTPSEAEQAAAAVDLDYMRDLLRGVHDCFLSTNGILGEKYGRKPEQVHATSDLLAKYLTKHMPANGIEKLELPLLIAGYLSLVAPIFADVMKERKKAAATKTKETKAP